MYICIYIHVYVYIPIYLSINLSIYAHICNIISRSQAEHVESMTAMATSHNRKYIGVCERLTDGGGQARSLDPLFLVSEIRVFGLHAPLDPGSRD